MSRHFLVILLGVVGVVAVIALLIFLDFNASINSGKNLGRNINESDLYKAALKRGDAEPLPSTVLVPLDLSQPVRLAIGSLGPADNYQNQQLGDLVTAELTGAPGFNLVERQSLAAILREMNLSLSGFVRAKDAVRAGKLLKADWFLLGTETKFNGTNAIMVRVVDARTGILRDAGVVAANQSPAKLAADVAAFARQSRQNAATAKTHVYLAIGAFEDLSVNNRQADFPTQLSGYLTAAYQGGYVTLLEREYVDTLLQEVRLDLAGLTEESDTNPPPPMQSAFWLVTGQYQSYETTNLQLELNLDVRRIFGKATHFTFRGLPGEEVGRKVKAAIDGVINQNTDIITPTRMSEARAQMAVGRELAEVDAFGGLKWSSTMFQDTDNEALAKHLRNMAAAVRAFKTVLLLEPDHREAKLYLAVCLQDEGQLDEARNYYREIVDDEVQDGWTGKAQRNLVESFYYEAPTETAAWFEAAERNATPAAAAFYHREAEKAAVQVVVAQGDSPQAEALAERRLFDSIQSFKNVLQGKGGSYSVDMGMGNYVKVFGSEHTTAAQKLVELLPKMKERAPDLELYLLAVVLTFQTDTNTPVAAEFQQALNDCIEHPEMVLKAGQFWDLVRGSVYDWCFEKTNYPLAINLIEGERRAATTGKVAFLNFDNREKVKLAYAYLAAEHWEQALDVFGSMSNQPVQMDSNGPWDHRQGRVVLTGKEAAYCREKLGQSSARDLREFDMGGDCFCLCTPSAFAVDETGLWIGINGRLMQLDFDLKTNFIVDLPMDASVPINVLCLGSSKIWIGTGGAGLIEFDKTTHKCSSLLEKDGLMMDTIAYLHLSDDTLWIGYGRRTYVYFGSGITSGGGLGKLDLTTSRFTSFSLSISNGTDIHRNPGGNIVRETTDKPTRRPVIAIAGGANGDIWFVTEDFPTRLRQYQPRDNVWTNPPQVMWNSSSLASDAERLFVGQYGTGQLGVSILDFKAGQWRSLKASEVLPSGKVSALTLDGNDLWVGGDGYLALVDPDRDKVRQFAIIPAAAVDHIQIGGGYVWAEYDGHLHRAFLGGSRHEFIQSNFAKFVPVQFQKDTNGMAVLQCLRVSENRFSLKNTYFCGFKFTVPPWCDGDFRLLYVLAKTEAEKDFSVKYMKSDIIPENGGLVGTCDYLREDLGRYPQLKKQFPYTGMLTTQNLDMKQLEPGKTYGIWFEFDEKNMPDIAFAMTVNSKRGTNEFGMLPLW